MFIKIFKLTDSNRTLINNYKHIKWRFECNSEIFGEGFNFSFKSRCKYAIKHPIRFIKNLYISRYTVYELIKAWYIWRQFPASRFGTSKNMFMKYYH